jgi:hypothetical protein
MGEKVGELNGKKAYITNDGDFSLNSQRVLTPILYGGV